MRFNRFSIGGIMAVVMTTALGLAALRSPTETCAGITLIVTCATLGLAVVGAICRGATERAWWLGFAIFGWGYLALAFWSPAHETTLPTMTGLVALCTKIGLNVPTVPAGRRQIAGIDSSFIRIGHYVLALIAASLGAVLASAFFGATSFRSERQPDDARDESRSRHVRRRNATVIGLSGLALASSVAVIGSRLTPPLWAGTTYLVICGLLGLAALGALVGKGLAREIWLGAALFGWGYIILAFGWHPFYAGYPHLVTREWLESLRPSLPTKLSGFPPCDDRTEPANARILAAIEQPIPMHFPSPTPLEDILRHIKKATASPDGKRFPIFVDPIGLQEAERACLQRRSSTALSTSLSGIVCTSVCDGWVSLTRSRTASCKSPVTVNRPQKCCQALSADSSSSGTVFWRWSRRLSAPPRRRSFPETGGAGSSEQAFSPP